MHRLLAGEVLRVLLVEGGVVVEVGQVYDCAKGAYSPTTLKDIPEAGPGGRYELAPARVEIEVEAPRFGGHVVVR
jgi:hypothetical protein